MKKGFILFIALMISLFTFGQSYNSLWKKVQEAENKDLPKTEYDLLQQIVKKADRQKDYGQLLKAELASSQVMAVISPDSLKPAMERLQLRCEQTDDEVLKIVYQTVLYRVDRDNYQLGLGATAPTLTPSLCAKLAEVKDEAYQPFVVKGDDRLLFNGDLLSVIGSELNDFEPLYDYYRQVGNRKAACIAAARVHGYSSLEIIDSLILSYQDLQEAGELAIARFQRMEYRSDVPVAEKLAFIRESIEKWGSWKRMNVLRNAEKTLTNPQFEVSYDLQVVRPGLSQEVRLDNIRNVSSLSMKVYPFRDTDNLSGTAINEKNFQKIKPHLAEPVIQVIRDYSNRADFEVFDDTLMLDPLPVGVYVVEFGTNPETEYVRHFYHVTDVYTIEEPLPAGKGIRYVVVNSTTGQPIPGARIRIRQFSSYSAFETFNLVTDSQGEAVFKKADIHLRREVAAYTDSDQACPESTLNGRYSYYGNADQTKRTCVFTDRSIYRPGQTVHVAALLYQVKNGLDQTVCDHTSVTFCLRDANYKIVEEKRATTDDYGNCSVDFTLPSSGLTGVYQIQVGDQTCRIRVEEYKRPTFHVDFPEVKEAYSAGETLYVKGVAQSYAGVPIQGAKVNYKVVRRTAFWWWSYSRYWNTGVEGYGQQGHEVFHGEAQTDSSGEFLAQVPLEMPDTGYPMFYQFVVTADVTDVSGETHSGELYLPLGNRKTALSIDLTEKVLKEEKPSFMFHLLNAAGKDIDADVRYQVDGQAWMTAKTNTPITIVDNLQSGLHTIKALCGEDSLLRSFTVFSLDDQQPATQTDDWFYQSATQFPNDGSPVTVQVGSSAKDMHIVYGIFAGEKIVEMGAVDKSEALLNRQFTYREEYGNGILLTFAWVKEGKCYTHKAEIRRPVPDKKLQLEWKTFRNRLVPGQQEEWTLTVKDADGNSVDAQLMATLYDQSLDQLYPHQWSFIPYIWLPLPSTQWSYASRYRCYGSAKQEWKSLSVSELKFSSFDHSVFPSYRADRLYMLRRSAGRGTMVMESAAVLAEPPMKMVTNSRSAEETADDAIPDQVSEENSSMESVQIRENLNETAFFYPQMTTDAGGLVVLRFTLPESLTTWRFLSFAHTKDLHYGFLSDEAVAQKDVMIQPNIPRFLRVGDKGLLTARLVNTTKKTLNGAVVLRLSDPETGAVVLEHRQSVVLSAEETSVVSFDYTPDDSRSLYVCQMTVSGKGFSDGEQNYLPVLPSSERVTVTVPFTQREPGTQTLNLSSLIPADGKGSKLTVEYTNDPAWLMIQALPTVGTPSDDNALSLGAAYYANALGKYLIDLYPQTKAAFEMWRQEKGSETSLTSALAKNQELKDLVLNETPWMMDADREKEQKQRLADFFDDNQLQNRLSMLVSKLKNLQKGNGAWAWWDGMPGSFYMTVAVSEMLVRLNAMAGTQSSTRQLLSRAFDFMGDEIVDIVQEMKKGEKDGVTQVFPSFKALQWLYLVTLDGRTLPAKVERANAYLVDLLKKDIKNQSLYEKALTAVILAKTDPMRAEEYVKSLKEYTVYQEKLGRYYDTPRAGYSWYDYRIPTQTVAIEALQRITPEDRQTVLEMQHWLLQEKRTQAWDTPINSVNAVYAFLGGKTKGQNLSLGEKTNSVIKVDGKLLSTPKATAAIGYIKTVLPDGPHRILTVEKSSEGTSWGAVYAQFTQQTSRIEEQHSGITISRELLGVEGKNGLAVGDRVKIRLTIMADRDYDFVQVVDKRAACLEPIRQLSGYQNGAYCTPKDYTTNYYYHQLSKGKHVIETEYYVDRSGIYETGTCTVQCAYAPEFRGMTPSLTIEVKK